MVQGLNTDTKQADQWTYGSISQYNQLLATAAKPLTVYAFNTSTGFHPLHSDTVYRGDDGGQTWRANYFQDSRFQSYNAALDGETASCGKCFKGGETPFGEAICNADPKRVIPARNEPHINPGRRRDVVRRSCLSGARPEARPALRQGLQRPGCHHHLAHLHRPVLDDEEVRQRCYGRSTRYRCAVDAGMNHLMLDSSASSFSFLRSRQDQPRRRNSVIC